MKKRFPRIIAHRGLRLQYPENTKSAIDAALSLPIDAVEFDVELTKDDQLVAVHQETLEPDAAGSKLELTTRDAARIWVREIPLQQVQQIDAGSWFDTRFSSERIPILSEVLNLNWSGKFAVMEIKDPYYFAGIDDKEYAALIVKKVAEQLQGFVAAGNAAKILSFSPAVLAECVRIIPSVPRTLALSRKRLPSIDSVEKYVESYELEVLTLNQETVIENPEWCEHARRLGCLLGTYESSPDLEQEQRGEWTADKLRTSWDALIALGVDLITTDFPQELNEVLTKGV